MKRFRMVILPVALAAAFATPISCIKVGGIAPEPLGMTCTIMENGVEAPVRIVRDENYLPHISGQNEEDVFFGLGFVMAQDRASQLDLLRKAATGSLSEIIGPTPSMKGFDLVKMDILLRTFRYREDAIEGYKNMAPRYKKLLESFSNGINAYLREIKDNPPFEAVTMKVDTKPWKPEDSLAIMELFGLTMTSASLFNDYYIDRLSAELGPEKAVQFIQEYPKEAPTIITTGARTPFPIGDFLTLDRLFDTLIPHPVGSNNWAVHPSRTASGKPLLANDPHVPLANIPTFWYHCHIKTRDYEAMGLMFPGFPAFGAATTGKIAWGLTNVMADYIDLFREKVNPENPGQYLYKGEWEDFEVVTGEVKIKGRKKTVPYSYRRTRHGSVIDDDMVGRYKIRKWAPGEVMAVRLLDVDMAVFFGGYVDLPRATDWDEFREACSRVSTGPVGWNHAYADIGGNIGYQTVANIPIRADNNGTDMDEGWTGEGDWTGYVPFEELPTMYNPRQGYLLSANNKVASDDYPYYISGFYFPSRAVRIDEFLSARESMTAKDMMTLQGDTVDVIARKTVPTYVEDLQGSGKLKIEVAAAILKKWHKEGCRADVDLVGPTVYYSFLHFFTAETLSDELGKRLSRAVIDRNPTLSLPLMMKIVDDPDNEWFDDINTNEREGRREIVLRAMKKGLDWVGDVLGKDMSKWQWGRFHTIKFGHPLNLFPRPILKGGEDLTRGPYPTPGSDFTVNARGSITLKKSGIRVVEGPSSRMIVDFAHPDWIYLVASTGMSSNPVMPNYDNLMDEWRKMEYLPMSFDETQYSRNQTGVIVIQPNK